jgi:hypothetical protein
VKSIFEKAIYVVLGVVALYILVMVSSWTSARSQYNRGDAVVILSETTTIVEDQVCQTVLYGNISYTGNGLNYYKQKFGFLGLPLFEYQVILKNGDTLWVDQDHLKLHDPDETYCSPLAK